MKAAYIVAPRQMELRETAVPQPGPGQVLVRVRAVGICGSDVHYYLHGRIGESVITSAHIPGHEFAGEVAAVAPDVAGLQVGQAVAVEPAIACHRCEMCVQGHPNLCYHIRFMSVPPDHGALCEYVVVEAERCFPLPGSLSFEEGAMIEPLGVALHAIRLASMVVGDRVGIVGCGPIGLLVLQLAAASGALGILATDKVAARLERARRYGAERTVNVLDEDPEMAARAFTLGTGLDVVWEATGDPTGPEQAIRLARNGGKVLLIGIPEPDGFTLTASIARRKGLTIKMVRRMKHTYPRAIALAAAGKVDLRGLITHRFPLERAQEAFELVAAQAEGVIKALILL